MIVRPVVQGRPINHAWSWADKSCDWICDHAIGRAIRGTVSRLVVRSITISDDWLHDLKTGRATSRHSLVVSYSRSLLLSLSLLYRDYRYGVHTTTKTQAEIFFTLPETKSIKTPLNEIHQRSHNALNQYTECTWKHRHTFCYKHIYSSHKQQLPLSCWVK